MDYPLIYRIAVELPENPLKALNSYVLRSGGKNLIIDTGFHRPECHTSLWNGIRELGLDLKNSVLFLTHLHADHIGLVGDFVEKGVPIYTGRIDYHHFPTPFPKIHGAFWSIYFVRRDSPKRKLHCRPAKTTPGATPPKKSIRHLCWRGERHAGWGKSLFKSSIRRDIRQAIWYSTCPKRDSFSLEITFYLILRPILESIPAFQIRSQITWIVWKKYSTYPFVKPFPHIESNMEASIRESRS